MPIPDYESLMLPLLKIAGDKKEHQPKEVTERLSDIFRLTPEEKEARLPSGRKYLMYSRVHWAKTYIMNAGLLESTARGKYRITQRGIDVLATNPSCINNEFLDQFQEFREFRQRRHGEGSRQTEEQETVRTPEELLESSYQELNDALARELLERIKQAPSQFFEQLVVDLLLAMGYGGSREDAGKVVGGVGDEGIDGTINEDRLGLEVVYVQAKRWSGSVGREQVQAFVGSLAGQSAKKGVMVTMSSFTEGAKDYVRRNMDKKVVLIDGKQLADLMIEYNIGVAEVTSYTVKRVDLDYFGEE